MGLVGQRIVAAAQDQLRAQVQPVGQIEVEPRLDAHRLGRRRCQDRYWLGADLVVEVVSPDRPERDLVDKRTDYAEAGIPEYWVVDPRDQTITVFELCTDSYAEHGMYVRGGEAESPLLPGFAAAVAEVFDAPETGA